MNASLLVFLFFFASLTVTESCPPGVNNERVEPLGLCTEKDPKCAPNAYCFPLQRIAHLRYQWVCCPNVTALLLPAPPLFPVFAQQTTAAPAPPLFPANNVHIHHRRSNGMPVTIPLDDASKQQVPFAVMNLVQQQIQRYPVFMLTLSKCPWCQRAKDLLDEHYPTLTYYYFDYDLNPDGNPIANAAMGVSGMRTVPMIYICQQLVGGFIDLQNLHASHQLQQMVEKCARL